MYIDSPEADAHFRQLACPSWTQAIDEADAALKAESNHRTDGRRRQFSVNIADRDQLEHLSQVLARPRSKVINLALSELAKQLQTFDDQYVRLFVESCHRIAHWLHTEKGCSEEEAIDAAGLMGQDKLMSRERWMETISGDDPICFGGGIITGADLVAGKKPSKGNFISRKDYVRQHFEGRVASILKDWYRNQMWRYIGANG